MSLNEWFCGRPINSGIESRYPLGTRTAFLTDRHRLTSIGVTLHERHTVAVLGTDTGHLIKVHHVTVVTVIHDTIRYDRRV